MPTYFDGRRSFEDISVTPADAVEATADDSAKKVPGINTKEFLEAADGVVGVFTLLNSTALVFVQSDLQGNIAKLRERCEKFPKSSSTLEEIVKDEAKDADGQSKKDRQKTKRATESLLWLTRGLSFTCEGLKNAHANKEQSLSASFQAGYSVTLEKFHNFFTKKAIGLALKACPTRETLYAKLGGVEGTPSNSVEKEVNDALEKWLTKLESIVKHVQDFFVSGKYDEDFV